MKHVKTLGVGVGLCLWALPLPAADPPSLAVFVTAAANEARKEVDDATKKALKQKREEASKARKTLEKQLKAELGKKREEWPDDKDDELYRLEEAEALANADYEYRKIDPEAIGDAVEQVAKAAEGKGLQAGRKERIRLVESAKAADLVVEVVARRSRKPLGAVVPNECWVLFTVGAGGKTDAARFAKIPTTYRPRKWFLMSWRVAGPSAERPVFTFEGYNGGNSPIACHGTAANSASGMIDKFIEDNYSVLVAQK